MSAVTLPHSVVAPTSWAKRVSATLVIVYALITIIPLLWIVATSFKTPDDSIAYPPKLLFEPSIEGYCNLFTTRTRQTKEYIAALPPATTQCDTLVRSRNMVIAGPSNVVQRFTNSIIIAFGSTFLAVLLGTLTAYGFSRFKVIEATSVVEPGPPDVSRLIRSNILKFSIPRNSTASMTNGSAIGRVIDQNRRNEEARSTSAAS